jgi:alkaline phosphatase
MKQTLLLFSSLMGIYSSFSQAPTSQMIDNTKTKKPSYCILYIGDGFGVSAKTAARMAMGQGTPGKRFSNDHDFRVLSLDKLLFSNMLTTHSANSWTTDSGPGASVYAAGENGKIDNEAISFDVAKGESVETILEAAKKQGYAVGLVTTTRVTHATPAAFASHTWFRDLEDYIAAQYLSTSEEDYEKIYNKSYSTIKPYNERRDWKFPATKNNVDIDVILGGGLRHFYPNGELDTVRNADNKPYLNNGAFVTLTGKRTDEVNLVKVSKKRGFIHINSRDALLKLDVSQFTPQNDKKLLGLFHSSHMSYEQDRQLTNPWEPSLFEMTEMAIKVLKAKGGEKGFFLLVEGGRIDHLEHANNGGISVVANGNSNSYTVDSDKPGYAGGGDANYSATPLTPRVPVYGSDYLIKEVLAFDYSVAAGRKLMAADDQNRTLIFSTSDHECGGTAIVGLHDSKNAQNNGTYVRTYALGPRQKGVIASSTGGANDSIVASPVNILRGDVDFGTKSPNGWFPNYKTYTFQGRSELWPRVDTGGRRIVVAYASNPLTNGNGTKAGGTPGNHTPMDVWVGGDDNVGGTFASEITGKGLLDNTSLTGIMAKFLKLEYPFSSVSPVFYRNLKDTAAIIKSAASTFKLFPNPVQDQIIFNFNSPKSGQYLISVFDLQGKLVKSIKGEDKTGFTTLKVDTRNLQNGMYVTKLTVNNNGKSEVYSGKLIVQK